MRDLTATVPGCIPAAGSSSVADRRASTIAAIDNANRLDPNTYQGTPLALAQGRAASDWLDQLTDSPSDALRLAVRAHHLRRWELRRASYPQGRAGYLKWRRDNKAHQANSLAILMEADGWPHTAIERARTLLARANLRTDTETQLLEDAACLVFLETQFDEMAERTEHDRMTSIVAKTLKKMSPAAVTLAASIGFSSTAATVLADAIALRRSQEANDD